MAPVRQVFLVQLLSNPPMYIQSVMETGKFFCFPGLSLPVHPDVHHRNHAHGLKSGGLAKSCVSTPQAIGTLPQQTNSPKTIFFEPLIKNLGLLLHSPHSGVCVQSRHYGFSLGGSKHLLRHSYPTCWVLEDAGPI